MKINPFVFRNYDIRGMVPEDLDAKKVEAIGKAYGTLLRRRKIRQAVVGRDCRLSGEEFQVAFIKGLTSIGVDVIDLGMIMTQMMYYAQYRFQTSGGAMITARFNLAGAGTSTAALAFGGYATPTVRACTEAYNGTSWTADSPLITARQALAGAGPSTAALAFGGQAGTSVACTEAYFSGIQRCTL